LAILAAPAVPSPTGTIVCESTVPDVLHTDDDQRRRRPSGMLSTPARRTAVGSILGALLGAGAAAGVTVTVSSAGSKVEIPIGARAASGPAWLTRPEALEVASAAAAAVRSEGRQELAAAMQAQATATQAVVQRIESLTATVERVRDDVLILRAQGRRR